jgi:hypothetical protein
MHIYNLFKEVQQRREFFDEAQVCPNTAVTHVWSHWVVWAV